MPYPAKKCFQRDTRYKTINDEVHILLYKLNTQGSEFTLIFNMHATGNMLQRVKCSKLE